jgi:hypothetical protein
MLEAQITLQPDETLVKIKESHRAGVDALVGSLRHFAQAGYHLREISNSVNNFEEWVSKNLSFSKKTAYQYIKLQKQVESGLDLESVNEDGTPKFTSLRQCLGIDHDGEKSTYSRGDVRFESIPGMCTKIEQTWRGVVRARPLSDWSEDERRVLASSLQPILDIYESLKE